MAPGVEEKSCLHGPDHGTAPDWYAAGAPDACEWAREHFLSGILPNQSVLQRPNEAS